MACLSSWITQRPRNTKPQTVHNLGQLSELAETTEETILKTSPLRRQCKLASDSGSIDYCNYVRLLSPTWRTLGVLILKLYSAFLSQGLYSISDVLETTGINQQIVASFQVWCNALFLAQACVCLHYTATVLHACVVVVRHRLATITTVLCCGMF